MAAPATLTEIETALTDCVTRLRRARIHEDVEAEMVFDAQLDRLLGMWQATSSSVTA